VVAQSIKYIRVCIGTKKDEPGVAVSRNSPSAAGSQVPELTWLYIAEEGMVYEESNY
jgi:hypothetical protein